MLCTYEINNITYHHTRIPQKARQTCYVVASHFVEAITEPNVIEGEHIADLILSSRTCNYYMRETVDVIKYAISITKNIIEIMHSSRLYHLFMSIASNKK